MTSLTRHLAAPAAAFIATLTIPAFAQDSWTLDRGLSSVTFTGTQQGSEFSGGFSSFNANIALDPADPSTGSITAEIDLSSADAGSEERNEALPTKDWFNTRQHPNATFVSDEIVSTGDGTYEATGTLTMKGISHPVVLPFTLEIDGDMATARGTLELVRTDYEVGTGAYASGSWVGLPVTVKIEISARRAG